MSQTIDLWVAESGGGLILLVRENTGPKELSTEQVRTVYIEHPEYEGYYNVTPGTLPQTLNTRDRLLTQDVIVGAIPQNYGLVTWNGAWLTIS